MQPRSSSGFLQRLKTDRLLSSLLVVVTLVVGILIGTVISYGVKGKEQRPSDPPAQLTVPAPQQLSSAFAKLAHDLEPSVVNINTESTVKPPTARRRRGLPPGHPGQGDDGSQDPFQDFFDRSFGGPGGGGDQGEGGGGGDSGVRERSLGFGVVVDSKGYIITNQHVVDKADRIRVQLMDDPPGTFHDAKVIGTDRETDLAVIKIEPNRTLP